MVPAIQQGLHSSFMMHKPQPARKSYLGSVRRAAFPSAGVALQYPDARAYPQ